MLNRSSTLRQIQVCHPEQHTTQRHAHMNILNGWITFVVFLIPETPFKRFLVMSFILIFFCIQRKWPSTYTSQAKWRRISEVCLWSWTFPDPTASSGATRKRRRCSCRWRYVLLAEYRFHVLVSDLRCLKLFHTHSASHSNFGVLRDHQWPWRPWCIGLWFLGLGTISSLQYDGGILNFLSGLNKELVLRIHCGGNMVPGQCDKVTMNTRTNLAQIRIMLIVSKKAFA